MSDTEIKMKEISNRITDLKLEYEELRGDYIEELQNKLSKLVGMSFKDNEHKYFRIIDVPLVEYRKTITVFNKYQLPALIYINDPAVRTDLGPLVIDTIFTNAADAEDPIKEIREDYEEITSEEFDKILQSAFDEIRSLGKRGDA